ncbi:MAG: elongation factor 4 [Lentisphaerae bacterium]|jgi:GTP-binding protein LepA|nr:elongation factor 4 [Lentisphaerota bacterium]
MNGLDKIRNFCIVAHVDHGKSTLADRFLLHTKTIEERVFRDQVLDAMDLEQERGITIKSHPVRMQYDADNGETYQFNLIDTPGHVDFSYEVSRSLAACEGAILLVDAAQGVQAQTMANVNLAINQGLEIIPVINKVDLPAANVPLCLEQFEEILAIPAEEVLKVSAKTGDGVKELLEAVIHRVPPPKPESKILQALVFDSIYDVYRGVVTYARVVNGTIKAGEQIRLFSTELDTEVKEVGFFSPTMKPVEQLNAGEVGYVITAIKTPSDINVGDTITHAQNPCKEALPGFQKISPMVFSGVYPIDTADYEALKANIAKLRLNDSAFVAQPESSVALGAGFRCGFLGLLHMDVVQERLSREYNMDLILTYPSVIYHVYLKNGKMQEIDNPLYMPDPSTIDHIEEPMIKAQIISPSTYMGNIMNLVLEKRGICLKTENVDKQHVLITARMPLHEIVIDFYDKLKTCTRGYGSMDYEPDGYQTAPTVKLEILVNGEPVDAFASICHADRAVARARMICERLKDAIPPQMFKVAIQGAIGGRIIAREDVRQLRKNVLAKCYGGDISRKRKLLDKQREGKKRMKEVGNVNIPQEAFVAVLRSNEE